MDKKPIFRAGALQRPGMTDRLSSVMRAFLKSFTKQIAV